MDKCTIEDAAQVLQNTSDIVRLKIRKDEVFAGAWFMTTQKTVDLEFV